MPTPTTPGPAAAPLPRLGLALSTIGRWALTDLLASAASSSAPPACVAVANQSGRRLPIDPAAYPFPVTVVESAGGVSRGRNDAVRALAEPVDVLAFPNDDSRYPATTLEGVLAAFRGDGGAAPQAVACSYVEAVGLRFAMPPSGAAMDRRTVWRALEATTFVTAACFAAVGGFREDLGSGSPGPWGSGEGTDLLLRVMDAGGTVLSRPDLEVLGAGERRDLSAAALVRKHRSYARGTGLLYREHGYRRRECLRVLAGPLVRPLSHDPSPVLSVRLAAARFLGRVEGLRGRPFSG